ncbi:GntR family transcriptional regulator [Streptomyces chartreusis]|uniref:GntR family transcriptional regulator n=1 Tax=Streptomyces chartreusis TaxID=1969 RepID=UPI003667C496
MLVTIDRASPLSLAEQIAASVRRNMADGTLRKGDRLPPARTLARTLDINMHTVLRGYQLLKDEKLIELRRGRGAVVTADAPSKALVIESCQQFVQLARSAGMSGPDIVQLVTDRLNGTA